MAQRGAAMATGTVTATDQAADPEREKAIDRTPATALVAVSAASAEAPIGVFDSGVGGLTVLRALRAQLPNEEYLYVADSAHAPYGSKDEEYIQQRAWHVAQFLLAHEAKLIVVACNTATAAAAAFLRARLATPVVGTEPALKPAAAATRSGVVGVLATTSTLQSAAFAALRARFGQQIRVVAQPCPGLVERIEAGDLMSEATRALVVAYTGPMLAAGADTIVLGCTHYPLIAPLIAAVAGPNVALIETGTAVARQVEHVLAAHTLLATRTAAGHTTYWTSGDPASVAAVAAVLTPTPEACTTWHGLDAALTG